MSATEIISESRRYADNWVDRADQLVGRLGDFSDLRAVPLLDVPNWDQLQPGSVTFTSNLLSLLNGNDWTGDADIGKVTFEMSPAFKSIDFPKAPAFDFDKFNTPDLNIAPPQVNIGNAPAPLNASAPNAPHLNPVSIPSAPTLNIPAPVEVSTTIHLPSVPTIDLPPALTSLDFSFVAAVPDAAFTFQFDEVAYNSVMLDEVKGKLLHDLQNGGYGIEPGDEVSLWERAREREAELASQELDTITRDFASRGFLLPPGALFAATEGIRAKTLAGAASLSRDVALKRADLLVQNRQFTIQQVREVEALLVNMHMAAMERVLRAAQISAQYAMEVFRARVEKAKLRLEAIQTQAQTFRDAVAAEAQKVEIYRAQLQAELSKMEIDKNRVELYRAKLSGVEMLANIYRIQVQAAEAAINAERSKVETYKAEIDGYLATVRAKELEFSAYEAQLRGEQTKVQLYGEQVRAHTARADAMKTRADVKALEVRAYSEAMEAAVRRFEVDVRAVAEKNGVLQKADEAKLRAFTAKMDALKARLAGAESYAQVGINEEVQRTRSRLEASRLSVDAAKAKIALNLDSDRFRMQAADAAVGVYKEMVVGALGALNSIASLSE